MKKLLTMIVALVALTHADNTLPNQNQGFIWSSDKQAMVHVARVQKFVPLEKEKAIKVSVVMIDTGGSTDVSPTYKLYFTLYKRGEMFSTDASFYLGYFFGLKSARKISNGIYELTVDGVDKHYNIRTETYTIDARQAMRDMDMVDCKDEFDCEASTYFRTRIAFYKRRNRLNRFRGDNNRYVAQRVRLDVPVMIGAEPDEDACGGVGAIRGINRYGDGFIAVRSGPGIGYRIIDKIYQNGTRVAMCDSHGRWEGIVYGNGNCGTGSPVPRRQPYNGECRVGWVYGKYVRLVAD